MKKYVAIILALVMVFSICLIGCGGDTDTNAGTNTGTNTGDNTNGGGNATGGGDDGVFREISIGVFGSEWAGTLDGSAMDSRANSYGTYNLVYDCMFNYDTEGEVYSQIFDSWEWSDDFLTLSCHLKDGITFANGDVMDADDVIFSIARKVASPTGSWYANVDPEQCYSSDDGRTVNVVYKDTYGPGLKGLRIYVMDKDFVEGLGEQPNWYDPASVNGSGPYEITEYTQDATISFEKREGYWDEDVYAADKINAIIYTDQTTMMIDLESGAIDIALNTSETDTAAALNGQIENVAGDVAWANAVCLIVFSRFNEYLQDERVREAICHAIDWEATNAAAFGCLGQTADSPLARGLNYYESGHVYEYNPELSRQLLAEAGYKDGDITLKYLSYNLTEIYAQAQIIQRYLADIGITLELESAAVGTAVGTYIDDPLATDIILCRQHDGIPDREPWMELYVLEGTYYMQAAALPDWPELQEYISTLKHSLVESERREAAVAIQNFVIDHHLVMPTSEFGVGVCYRTDTVVDPHILNNVTCNLRFVELV